MKKVFFRVILIITIIMEIVALSELVIVVSQDTTWLESFQLFKGNKKNIKQVMSKQEKTISYEDKQMMMSLFPNFEFRKGVYYSIYGKEVLDSREAALDLSDIEIDENLIKYLTLCPNIKEVNLYNQKITNDGKKILKEKFPNIHFKWEIEILGEKIDCDVESINFSKKTINNIDDFKKALMLFDNLKKLDLSYTNLSNEQLGELREEFKNIKIDWVVHLGKWSLRTDAVAFSVLVYKFDYKRMTSKDIEVLKYCTELQALDIGHQAIEDISVIGDYLPNLRVLILADNKIKDISPIAKLKHLHYLELFMNDITDSSPLAECKELVDLNISFNYRFSDISGILNLPMLERLWLVNDRISADSYNLIRKTYPNVKLVTTGEGSTESGWRTHERYYAMIDMYKKNYISESFLKYDSK